MDKITCLLIATLLLSIVLGVTFEIGSKFYLKNKRLNICMEQPYSLICLEIGNIKFRR